MAATTTAAITTISASMAIPPHDRPIVKLLPAPHATVTFSQHFDRYTAVVMKALRRSPIVWSLTYVVAIGACLAGIVAIHWLEPADETLTLHGVYDELGHALTALVAVIGVRALRLPVPAWSVVLGGMILDLGHVPQMLGYASALEGSTRNGSHSLAVVAFLACLGFLDRRHADVWLGIAIGATSHLWRDMGTGTVPLLWPLRETVYDTLYTRYLAVLDGTALAMIGSATLLGVQAQSKQERPREPQAIIHHRHLPEPLGR
jgi:membrane-bound metal-dependent hydrolase YbcI (DUF457 family)